MWAAFGSHLLHFGLLCFYRMDLLSFGLQGTTQRKVHPCEYVFSALVGYINCWIIYWFLKWREAPVWSQARGKKTGHRYWFAWWMTCNDEDPGLWHVYKVHFVLVRFSAERECQFDAYSSLCKQNGSVLLNLDNCNMGGSQREDSSEGRR